MDGMYLALFTGSRGWTDEEAIGAALDELPSGARVIVGDAAGADEIVTRLAKLRGVDVEVCPADWDIHGRSAGVIRNVGMLDRRPDVIYVFQLDHSRGTMHVIREARRRGIELRLKRV